MAKILLYTVDVDVPGRPIGGGMLRVRQLRRLLGGLGHEVTVSMPLEAVLGLGGAGDVVDVAHVAHDPARVALDLVDGVQGEHLDLEMVRSRPFPFPPEPLRWVGAQITMASIARADERGGPNLWLRLLHRLGIRI